jgi:hypothetical protein
VSRAVYVRVVTSRRFVLYVGSRDGDTTLTLFRSIIDAVEGNGSAAPYFCTYASQCGSQSSFTVVNVADSTNVNVGLVAFK